MKLLKEIKPIFTLILAVLIFLPLSVIGVIWNIGKPLFHVHKGGFKKIFTNWIFYWFFILYQLWTVIKYLLNKCSVGIDLLGNVICGEFLEDLVTTGEDTWFGNGKKTVSAAIGYEEKNNRLVSFGKFMSDLLGQAFEKNHCKNSYDFSEMVEKFKDDRNIKFDN